MDGPPPHSPGQRRMMSRSFDLDELTIHDDNQELPRCPSLDHVLSLAGGKVLFYYFKYLLHLKCTLVAENTILSHN